MMTFPEEFSVERLGLSLCVPLKVTSDSLWNQRRRRNLGHQFKAVGFLKNYGWKKSAQPPGMDMIKPYK